MPLRRLSRDLAPGRLGETTPLRGRWSISAATLSENLRRSAGYLNHRMLLLGATTPLRRLGSCPSHSE